MPRARTTPKRTQEERSTATRAALLDATIDSLIRFGYAATTTTRVVELAGVSRGAQVHHFPMKAQLVVAALEHLAERRSEEMLKQLPKLPEDPEERLVRLLDLLYASHTDKLFQAALELWVAARTDKELRGALRGVERGVSSRVVEGSAAIFGDMAQEPGFEDSLRVALATMRGLSLMDAAVDDRRAKDRWPGIRERLVTLFHTPRAE